MGLFHHEHKDAPATNAVSEDQAEALADDNEPDPADLPESEIFQPRPGGFEDQI